MSEPPRFDAFRDSIKSGAEQVRLTLEPDEDWIPTLFMDAPQGFMAMPLILEDGSELFGQPGLELVTAVIVKSQARLVARIQMGWAANAISGDTRRPGDRPDRSEVLILQVAEPGRQEVWMAEVTRNEDASPDLDEWELSEAAGGPIADALAAAIQVASQQN